MSANRIVMVSAALDENGRGDIFLRGVLTSDSLKYLQVDDYQREAQPLKSLAGIVAAIDVEEIEQVA